MNTNLIVSIGLGNLRNGAAMTYANREPNSASAATFMRNNCSAIGDHFEGTRVMSLETAFENMGKV